MIVSIRFGVENSAGVKVERSLPLSQYLPASARPPPSGSAVTARFIKADRGICGEVAGCEKKLSLRSGSMQTTKNRILRLGKSRVSET